MSIYNSDNRRILNAYGKQMINEAKKLNIIGKEIINESTLEDEYSRVGGDSDDFDIPMTSHHYVIFKKWYYPEYMIKDNPTLHEGDFEVTAWFPKEEMCYSKDSGHGDCDNDVVSKWEDASEDEYSDILKHLRKDVYRACDGDFLHVVGSMDEIEDCDESVESNVQSSLPEYNDLSDYMVASFGDLTGKNDGPYSHGFDFWWSLRRGLENNGMKDYNEQTEFIKRNKELLLKILDYSYNLEKEYESKIIELQDEFDEKRNKLVYAIEGVVSSLR